MNLYHHLESLLAAGRDELAIVSGVGGRLRREATFAELASGAEKTAAHFRAAGLQPGDRVLFLQPIGIPLYAALLGAWRVGLVVVLPDAGAGLPALRDGLRRIQPQAVLTPRFLWPLLFFCPELRRMAKRFSFGPGLPGSRDLTKPHAFAGGDCGPVASVENDSPALMTTTSGSTGMPKVAVRSHGFLQAQLDSLSHSLGLKAAEIDYTTLPVFVLANLANGVCSVLAALNWRRPGRSNPALLCRQIAVERPNRMACSPAILALVAREWHREMHGEFPIRTIHTGGGPVTPRLLRELQALLPEAAITIVYGSTEAEPIAEVAVSDLGAAENSSTAEGGGLCCGHPVPGLELAILPDHHGKPLGPFDPDTFSRMRRGLDQPGEIVVTGTHVLGGYLDGAGDEENKISVGDARWHRTGDAGRMDSAGRVWLLGRCSAGHSTPQGVVYPLQVEAAALEHPGIVACGFAVVDGQPILAMVPGSGFSADQLQALRSHLARLVPNIGICRVARIPMDRRHNAKVDYPALRRHLARCGRIPTGRGG